MKHEGAASLKFSDTTPGAMKRYVERLRATMSDVRRQLPNATKRELAVAFVRRVYGDAIADRFALHQLKGEDAPR